MKSKSYIVHTYFSEFALLFCVNASKAIVMYEFALTIKGTLMYEVGR